MLATATATKYANKLYSNYFDTEKECFSMTSQNQYNRPTRLRCILCGGFPCQSFQLQEKDEDEHNKRHNVFLKSHGFYQTKDRDILYSKMLKAYLITTVEKLSKQFLKFSPYIGYKVQWQLLNSKFFGVPQKS